MNFAPGSAALPEVPQGGFEKAGARLSPLPQGVSIEENPFEAFPESGMGKYTDDFIIENSGRSYSLKIEGEVSEPILLETDLSAESPYAATRIDIEAAPGARATVLSVARGEAESGINMELIRVKVCDGADISLIQVQLLGENVRRYNAVAIDCLKGASLRQTRIELGAGVCVCGSKAQLGQNRGEYDLDAVYIGDNDNVLDFNDVSVHTAHDTLCEMHTSGLLSGRADKILRGTIDFRRGAVRGVGHESEDVLLFSESARNRTVPLILCGEELVEGQHAASIGRLDEAKLYYLCSRGLTEAQAKHLMVEARFAPAIDKIPIEALRAETLNELERRLSNGEG